MFVFTLLLFPCLIANRRSDGDRLPISLLNASLRANEHSQTGLLKDVHVVIVEAVLDLLEEESQFLLHVPGVFQLAR